MAPHHRPEAPSAEQAAWRFYMELRENPCRTRALKLAHWLREDPAHPAAFERALRLWALAGAAMVVNRRSHLHRSTGVLE